MKQLLDSTTWKYSSNALALVDAIAVGVIGSLIFYAINDTAFNIVNLAMIIVMTLAVWLSSMLGYDKVIQLIKQIGDITE